MMMILMMLMIMRQLIMITDADRGVSENDIEVMSMHEQYLSENGDLWVSGI